MNTAGARETPGARTSQVSCCAHLRLIIGPATTQLHRRAAYAVDLKPQAAADPAQSALQRMGEGSQ